MRDRNIFAELPVEEILENTVSENHSIEAHPKRSAIIKKRIKKIKSVNVNTVEKGASLNCINIEDFEKLSINSLSTSKKMFDQMIKSVLYIFSLF